MRITVDIDENLMDTARRLTGIDENDSLVREGLEALVERESARRLALLGGSEPGLQDTDRRRVPTS